MEVVIPASRMDFDFNHSRPSLPHLSAPSTPRRIGEYYFSAPSSPTRMSEFYQDLNEFSRMNESYERKGNAPSMVPFDWEEKPGTPKLPKGSSGTKDEDDFAFDFSEDLEKASLSADVLFDGGKIRPLKPPPRLQLGNKVYEYTNQKSPLLTPRSPRSPISQGRKMVLGAFSPRRKKDTDPFAKAVENTRNQAGQERGRERTPAKSSSNSSRKAIRSLSPIRVAEVPWEEEEEEEEAAEEEKAQQSTKQSPLNSKASISAATYSSSSSSKSSKKWSLKDFLLFRSASEGRATDKDPFRKYSALYKRHEDTKIASFRSTDSSGSVTGAKRRGPVSAHELHYTTNKAASEDLKKKTFLPYKQGILGRLAFNPAIHALANGFGTLARS
ncbi:uncharacterized protein LOC112029334 [Quercus suber]|uniref:uncharacterized protein LOC112029334 n=1 Tax=Quercus suber TaxID=58331 RepID=UPI0032DF24BA